MCQFKVGDKVIVVRPDSGQNHMINKVYTVTKVDSDVVHGIGTALFSYKLELLSVYESPLYQELK